MPATRRSSANFCLLTQDANLDISKRKPAEYLAEVEQRYPGALASQWIPTDRSHWAIDRYRAFLAERRQLLADAAITFLDELKTGAVAAAEELPKVLTIRYAEPDDRQREVQAVVDELVRDGYGQPQVDAEVSDPVDGRVLTVAEAFWPDGLQAEQGPPVVLELDPDEADLQRLQELGYEVFTSVESLRRAVERRAEVAAGLRVAE